MIGLESLCAIAAFLLLAFNFHVCFFSLSAFPAIILNGLQPETKESLPLVQ